MSIYFYKEIDVPLYQVTNDMALYMPLNQGTKSEDLSIGKTYDITSNEVVYGFYNGVSSAVVNGSLSATEALRIGNSYSFWTYVDTTKTRTDTGYSLYKGWLRVEHITSGVIMLRYPSGSSYGRDFFISDYTGWAMITLRVSSYTLYATAYLKDGSKIEKQITKAYSSHDGFSAGNILGSSTYESVCVSNYVIYHGETGGIPVEQSVFDGLYEQVKSYYGH